MGWYVGEFLGRRRIYHGGHIFGFGATMRVTAEGDRLSYRSNTIYDSLALPMYIYAYPGGGDLFFDATSATRYRFIAAADGRPGRIEIKDGSDIACFPWIGP